MRGIAFTEFQKDDVVRHPLVARIVSAYEAYTATTEKMEKAERIAAKSSVEKDRERHER